MKYADAVAKKAMRVLLDKPFLYLYFHKHTGRFPNLKNPRRYTDKVQWLKLYGHLEQFTTVADKYTVRPYVVQKIGRQHLVPLIGVWNSFSEIDFAALPQSFVLKASHGCEFNYICKDKSIINYDQLEQTVNKWLATNFYKESRESQYKFCKPRIICEQYLEDSSGELSDYKFTCSNGEPKFIQVDTGRFVNHRSDLFDLQWNKLRYVSAGAFDKETKAPTITKPRNLQEMLNIARKLAKDFSFVRVDLYSVGNKIYFGELTFTPGSGIVDLTPESGDIKVGDLIDLEAYARGNRQQLSLSTKD